MTHGTQSRHHGGVQRNASQPGKQAGKDERP